MGVDQIIGLGEDEDLVSISCEHCDHEFQASSEADEVVCPECGQKTSARSDETLGSDVGWGDFD